MSDIVTNAEVEDVLSSIRRLVGDNKRPVAVAENTTDSDHFVLTPQLRVTEQDVLLLQPEDAVTPSEDWYEFEEPPLPEPDARAMEAAQVYGESAETAEGTDEAYVQDEQEYDAVAGDASSDEAMADIHAAGREIEEPDEPVAQPAPEEISEKRQDFFALSAKIAALETAIAKTSDQWEPDGDGRDAYAGTQSPTMTWQEDVELDATGKPLQARADTEDTADSAEPKQSQGLEETLDEHIMDEEMLRELVADIVRSELQGDLGERITRNVRKLVRREIHRALAAHSLD